MSAVIVMSVEEQQAAEVLLVARQGGRAYWKAIRATVSGDTLDFLGRERGVRYTFNWRNGDGGGVTMLPSAEGGDRPRSASFARLDG